MTAIAPYVLATCRPETQTIFDDDGHVVQAHVDANVADYCRLIRRAAADHDARLIAFPQFGLSGYAALDNDRWVAGAIEMNGPQVAQIAAAARAANAYVVIQAAERHPAFPGRYFLSAALITPEGRVGIVYRKHYTLSLRTSPIDVHDAFVKAFGSDAFFPVIDTPIGRIGLTIGAEVHWPEVTRTLALKGAEIIVNLVAAVVSVDYLNRPGAEKVRSVRAFENMTYLAMANMAGTEETPPSQIYDYEGQDISEPVADGSPFTLAKIDIARLRAARAAPGANLLAQLQPAVHEDLRQWPLWPANLFDERPAAGFESLLEAEAAAHARFDALISDRAER